MEAHVLQFAIKLELNQGKNRTPSANDMDSLRPIQRSQSHDFVRSTLKTTDIPLDVRYKGLVGGKIPLCHNIFKGEPLDNEGLMRKSFLLELNCILLCLQIPLHDTSHLCGVYDFLYIQLANWVPINYTYQVNHLTPNI